MEAGRSSLRLSSSVRLGECCFPPLHLMGLLGSLYLLVAGWIFMWITRVGRGSPARSPAVGGIGARCMTPTTRRGGIWISSSTRRSSQLLIQHLNSLCALPRLHFGTSILHVLHQPG